MDLYKKFIASSTDGKWISFPDFITYRLVRPLYTLD
jgi:hypothetical protein